MHISPNIHADLLITSCQSVSPQLLAPLCKEEPQTEEQRQDIIEQIGRLIKDLSGSKRNHTKPVYGSDKRVRSRECWEGNVVFTLFNYITVSKLHVKPTALHNKDEAGSFPIWRAACFLSGICLSYNSD